ncbi:MAG: hypothetical protein ACD_21C00090G0018 [uncultured bacterium]|nr:MAG: hypothetical protein ACD_21C00090G0018 [uncultured bacterium]
MKNKYKDHQSFPMPFMEENKEGNIGFYLSLKDDFCSSVVAKKKRYFTRKIKHKCKEIMNKVIEILGKYGNQNNPYWF